VLEGRFAGKLFELRVPIGREGEPLPAIKEIERSFRSLYLAEYGFDLPDAQVQAVNLRLIATIDLGHPSEAIFSDQTSERRAAKPCRTASILTRRGEEGKVSVYRASDAHGTTISGPAIIEHSGATVWVHDRQSARIESNGQVTVTLSGSSISILRPQASLIATQ